VSLIFSFEMYMWLSRWFDPGNNKDNSRVGIHER